MEPELSQELSETERIAVYYDNYPYSFEDITGDSFGVYTLRIARGYSDIKGGELTEQLDRLTRYLNHDQYESAIGKYLTLHNLDYKVIELRGYSQGEWASVIVYGDDWITDAKFTDLEAWFRGDIYTMTHERLETYTSESGNTIERWETIDSIGCIILEDTDDLIPIAREHFTFQTELALA